MTPPAGEAISAIELVVPTDVKVGDTDKKVTVKTGNITGDYTIKAAAEGDESVSFTITTTNEKGFAQSVSATPAGWTVTVDGTNNKTATVTGKVKIAKADGPSGDDTKAPGNVAVDETNPKKPALTYYYAGIGADGKAAALPTGAVVMAALQKKMPAGTTITNAIVANDKTVTLYETKDGKPAAITGYTTKVVPVYSIALNNNVKVWADGTEDGGKVLVATTYKEGTKLIGAAYVAAENMGTKGYTVDANQEVEVSTSAINANVNLQLGYKVDLSATTATAKYSEKTLTADEWTKNKEALNDGGYIANGLYIQVTGVAAKAGTWVAMTRNGDVIGSVTKLAEDKEKAYDAFQFSTTMAKDGAIVLGETSGYKLKIDGVEQSLLYKKDDSQEIDATHAGKKFYSMSKNGEPWAAQAKGREIEASAETLNAAGTAFCSKISLKEGVDEDKDGVISLYSADKFVEVAFVGDGVNFSVMYKGSDGKWVNKAAAVAGAGDTGTIRLIKSGETIRVSINNGTVQKAVGKGEAADLTEAEKKGISISGTETITFSQKA